MSHSQAAELIVLVASLCLKLDLAFLIDFLQKSYEFSVILQMRKLCVDFGLVIPVGLRFLRVCFYFYLFIF